MFMVDGPNHQVAFLRSVFCGKDDVLRLPQGLHFDKVDAVFRFIALALPQIELKFHDADLTNAPARRASRATRRKEANESSIAYNRLVEKWKAQP